LDYRFPDIFEKLFCKFNDNRTAEIKIDNFTGPPIDLESGVAQDSIISPLLFLIYTNNLPEAGPGSTEIILADDVTQVITEPSKNLNEMGHKVAREVTRTNNYEFNGR